jgi:hypothetical protein
MARVIENKLVFVHVAKTGGTFVREAVNYLGYKNWETGPFEEHDHIPVSAIPEQYKHLPTFGVVRRPFEWICSRWKWAKYTEFGERIKFMKSARAHWMADVWSEDLNQFLFNVINKRPGIAVEYQYGMLGIGNLNQDVSHILRTENLAEELSSLLAFYLVEGARDSGNFHAAGEIHGTLSNIGRPKELPAEQILVWPFLKTEIEFQNKELLARFYHGN